MEEFVNPTTQSLCLTVIGVLISGLIIIIGRSPGTTRKIGLGFYFLTLGLRVALLIITILAISTISSVTYSKISRILSYPGSLVSGIAIASVGFVIWQST